MGLVRRPGRPNPSGSLANNSCLAILESSMRPKCRSHRLNLLAGWGPGGLTVREQKSVDHGSVPRAMTDREGSIQSIRGVRGVALWV
jgi:hypothetical protein